ncbi:MAG: EamA family transporter RarD [Pirellulaceae bacterium]
MRLAASSHRAGLVCAVLAHVMWGLFPLFWRLLRAYDSLEVVSYRVVFAWIILLGIAPLLWLAASTSERVDLLSNLRSSRVWFAYALGGLLIFANWLVFLWAVGHDRVLEASLGYYINPLLNVVLGVLIIKERLTATQWSAVAIAAVGVAIMTSANGYIPWISLVLAGTFSLYGLVKKQAKLPPLWGLLIETSVLIVPALVLLTYFAPHSGPPQKSVWVWGTLLMGGVITIAPLSLFAFAARRVSLSTLGILQYIGPTLQFIIGVWILAEPFGTTRMVGFCFVWLALLIYVRGTFAAGEPRAAVG